MERSAKIRSFSGKCKMSNVSGAIKRSVKFQIPGMHRNKAQEEKSTLVKDRNVLCSLGYFVGRKIDSGTFATVRYAEKTSIRGTERLAVKIIDKTKATSLFTEKFLPRELEIWPKLHHRNIILVENIFPIQDRIYVFMELAPMGSVIEYVQSHGAIPEDLALNWCRRMCQALRYCHRKGIAHRDLKCDNLLLDKDLQIKIGDFGFCCRTVDQTKGRQRILSETHCGSSSYVAPEVIEMKAYDPLAADVWSAGVCIYVILNNAMPFDDSNIKKMHEDQVKRNWVFASEVKNTLTTAAKKLITSMLEPVVLYRPSIEQVLDMPWMKHK